MPGALIGKKITRTAPVSDYIELLAMPPVAYRIALWLCGYHGPLHFRAVLLKTAIPAIIIIIIIYVCSSYSDGMTASSFIVYNITACSVPNKYRWTTLKSMIERSRSWTQSRIFIFAADLLSVPVINRNTYHDLHIIS